MSVADAVPPGSGRTNPRAVQRPVPWAAAALAVLAPGAGHLYAGRPVTGAALGVGFVLAAAAVPFGLMAAPNALVLAAVFAALAALYVAIAARAWAIARDDRVAVRPGRRLGAILV